MRKSQEREIKRRKMKKSRIGLGIYHQLLTRMMNTLVLKKWVRRRQTVDLKTQNLKSWTKKSIHLKKSTKPENRNLRNTSKK
ncbi:hypothetical protein DPMN_191070 [Dreissena polymorpha]|uniref:Uncharacterized protein n=1 Tax=Dreissena polymorpha TaxID=45954 RepID=A0A9D3Y1R4_DREPO|nr:hypothetical protein DPMN_191070 [Dreissena polymorpha]